MKKLFYVTLSLLFITACNIKEQSEIQKEVIEAEDVITISADSLVRSFAKDSAAASDLYIDEVLLLNGEVAVFENMDTIDVQTTDSLPGAVKWVVNRLESDFNASNIIFSASAPSPATGVSYSISATFPKEYRKELSGVKEKAKVLVKGKLEHVSTLSQTQADSTKKNLVYFIELQGCVLVPTSEK